MSVVVGQRLLIDLDGVLADFDLGFVRAWQALGGERPLVAPAARRHFHLCDDYPAAWRDAVTATIMQPGFYRQLPPMPGAQAVLAQLARQGYALTVCTSPGPSLAERQGWLDEHFGPALATSMLALADKTLADGDWLIDDNPHPCGAQPPRWRHVLFDQPYNRHLPGPRVSWLNWPTHWPPIQTLA